MLFQLLIEYYSEPLTFRRDTQPGFSSFSVAKDESGAATFTRPEPPTRA